ncbi:MAG: hypothetical protein ACTHU0_26610 [Kofleriaceae bacterium]
MWFNNPGHGRRCACGEEISLGLGGGFLPALLVGLVAIARVILARASASAPLPRAALVPRSPFDRLASRWSEACSAAAASRSFHRFLDVVNIVANIVVAGIALWAFTMVGTGWLAISLSHFAVFGAVILGRRAPAA